MCLSHSSFKHYWVLLLYWTYGSKSNVDLIIFPQSQGSLNTVHHYCSSQILHTDIHTFSVGTRLLCRQNPNFFQSVHFKFWFTHLSIANLYQHASRIISTYCRCIDRLLISMPDPWHIRSLITVGRINSKLCHLCPLVYNSWIK